MEGTPDKLLTVRGLCSRYETGEGPGYAVDGVDWEVGRGESVGIAGESACGKTTLGLSLMRMLEGGSTGSIVFEGRDILEMSGSEFDKEYRWKKISMVFQGAMNSLDPVFTVGGQFDEILARHDRSGAQGAVADAMASVGLGKDVLQRYPHELSGGMKQRVIIAMALLLGPRLVIADEPTTALDVLTQARIMGLLKSLKKGGTSFVMITHDLAILSEIADRIGIMYGGQMVEFGSARDVYSDPKHPYTRGLLESVPTISGGVPGYVSGSPPSLLDAPTACRFIDRCPLAVEKCKENPPKFETGSGYVRCWLYEDG